MSCMDITPSPDGIGSTITVRLDSRTDNRLAALVEHFTDTDPMGRQANVSQTVRRAIDVLYDQQLRMHGEPTQR